MRKAFIKYGLRKDLWNNIYKYVVVFRPSGSFFFWTANKSVWHCGLHNHFSNCRLNNLLGQSFCTDIFLNSILLFSYFPVPAPDKLGWSLLHWFERAGDVWWTWRANLTDWEQYPLYTKHPCWCTLYSLNFTQIVIGYHFHIARMSCGINSPSISLCIWVMNFFSICFYGSCKLPEHFCSQWDVPKQDKVREGKAWEGCGIFCSWHFFYGGEGPESLMSCKFTRKDWVQCFFLMESFIVP